VVFLRIASCNEAGPPRLPRRSYRPPRDFRKVGHTRANATCAPIWARRRAFVNRWDRSWFPEGSRAALALFGIVGIALRHSGVCASRLGSKTWGLYDPMMIARTLRRAVFRPTDGVGCTSGLERTTDLDQTSHEVRKVPTTDSCVAANSRLIQSPCRRGRVMKAVITRSHFAGSSMGNSAGFSPFKTFCTHRN
jgi:hypothetical protein